MFYYLHMLNSERTLKRREAQLDILSSGINITVGDIENLPVTLDELLSVDESHPFVEKVYSGGLSAVVYKLKINGKRYNLKKKRDKILVENVDGQTSFLNEVQRRKELDGVKRLHPEDYKGIVDTIYADLNAGIIFSEWIDGEEVSVYTREIFRQLFMTLFNMEKIGIFENDPTVGNIVITDSSVKLFDFGYAYRFDPLKELNMEGFDQPVFHIVERFESRAFMIHLLDIEEIHGIDKTLNLYKLEKEVAIEVYKHKICWLKMQGAETKVIEYFETLVKRWFDGLLSQNKLLEMYRLEQFRSFLIDVVDDISGKSCTPDTLIKVENILETLEHSYDYLLKNGAFFWEDSVERVIIIQKYQNYRTLVKEYQLKDLDGFNRWKKMRKEIVTGAYHSIC